MRSSAGQPRELVERVARDVRRQHDDVVVEQVRHPRHDLFHQVRVEVGPALHPFVSREGDARVDLLLGAGDVDDVVATLGEHVRRHADHRVVAARLGTDRALREQRWREREPVRVVLAPPGAVQSAQSEFGSSHRAYIVERSSGFGFSVIPNGSSTCWSSASCFGYGSALSLIVSTSLHSGASHTPSPSASYFDCAISSFALSRSPAPSGVRVRVVVLEQVVLQAVHHDVARRCRRRSGRRAAGGTPACPAPSSSPCACGCRRTAGSPGSSPGSARRRTDRHGSCPWRSGSVEYCWTWFAGGTASRPRSMSPASIFNAMSSAVPPIVVSMRSGYAGRSSSVDASHDGLRTSTIDRPGEYPATRVLLLGRLGEVQRLRSLEHVRAGRDQVLTPVGVVSRRGAEAPPSGHREAAGSARRQASRGGCRGRRSVPRASR